MTIVEEFMNIHISTNIGFDNYSFPHCLRGVISLRLIYLARALLQSKRNRRCKIMLPENVKWDAVFQSIVDTWLPLIGSSCSNRRDCYNCSWLGKENKDILPHDGKEKKPSVQQTFPRAYEAAALIFRAAVSFVSQNQRRPNTV